MTNAYIIHNGELYHYGVKGMKWGHRKKYYTSSGNLNKLGQARKLYETTKQREKTALKAVKKTSRGFGLQAIKNNDAARKVYKKASADAVNAKAQYKAAKAKNAQKAEKAEFKTYSKEMAKIGLPGSVNDANSFGKSTSVYNSLKAKKGKKYADAVLKSANRRVNAGLATSVVTLAGLAVVESMLLS